MLFEILTILLAWYIIRARKRVREKIRDAETVEAHYPDGSFTYLSERDLL